MCSNHNLQHNIRKENIEGNGDRRERIILNDSRHSLSSGSSTCSSDIDLLHFGVKKDKSKSSIGKKPNISTKSTISSGIKDDKSHYSTGPDEPESRINVKKATKRRSGITFSDFQLRRSQIERLLLSPEELDAIKGQNLSSKASSKSSHHGSKEKVVEKPEVNINKLGDCCGNSSNFDNQNSLINSEIPSDNKSFSFYGDTDTCTTNDACLKFRNLNSLVTDKPYLSSAARLKFEEEEKRGDKLKLKCPKSRCLFTKQSRESDTVKELYVHSSDRNINLLKIQKSKSDHTLKDRGPSDYYIRESASKSQSDIELSGLSSCANSSSRELLCEEEEDEKSPKDRRGKKTNQNFYRKPEDKYRKQRTVQSEKHSRNRQPPFARVTMYCGDHENNKEEHEQQVYYHAKFGGDSPFKDHLTRQCDGKEMKRVFPFEATPSGNLKVGPKQVVFQSKKVSVLVADPYKTKVNVKADVENKTSTIQTSTTTSGGTVPGAERMLPLQMQLPPVPRDLLTRIPPPLPQNRSPTGAGGGGGPAGNGRIDGGDFPLTPPIFVNRNEENSCEETRDGKKSKHVPEMNLVRMGYSGKEQIDWAKISLPLKSDLHKLLHQRISNFINPDFIVQIGNHEYRCHLLVLQCYSSFFENMDKNTNTVDLSSNAVTGDAFESLYTWMLHLGQDSYQLLRRDNILEMFTAAQYLGVKELEEQCWAFIDNEELFSEDTAFLLYLDARRLGNTAVMELMVPRIQRFFLTLVSSKDWLELQVDEVTVFLRSNYICIHCEMEVFMSGVRWLMNDWPKRNIHLVEVMHCVRFGLIAPWQLVDIRRNPESPEFIEITKDADVQKMVEDGLAFAIIKYWYGHESHDYYHWIDLLGLTEPAGRNWAGTEKNYLAYREFLMDLENYRTNHQKSLTDKKKPKSAPSEDSCEESAEETISREIPAQQVLTVGNTQIERSGNRKTSQAYNQSNQIPPPPLPNMTEFMGRRGETNPKERSKLQNTGNTMDGMKSYIKVNKTQNHHNVQDAKYDNGLLNCNVGFVELCDDDDNDGDNDDDYQDSSEIQMNTVTYNNWNSSNIRVDDGHNCAIDYYNCYKHKYKVNNKINKLANKIRKKQKETFALSSDDDHYKKLEKKEENVVPLRKTGSSPIVNQTSVINKTGNKNCNTETNNNNNQVYKSDNCKTQWKGTMSSLKNQAAIIIQCKVRQYLAKKKYQKLIQEKINRQLEIAEENKRKEKEQLKKMEEDEHKKRYQEKELIPRHKETYVFNTTMKQDETVKNKRSESKMKTIYYTGLGNDPNCLSSYPPTTVKNENVIPDVPYVVRKKSDSHSSIARPVRIGAMPAEYLLPGSLFFSNKEAVLVFGGVDPHHSFSVGHNTGKNVFRYVMNRRHWDLVDELPEPRHHHSVIFFRGRVYLIGGADPRSTSGESKSNIVGSVYSFDPVSRMWAIESPLNTPRKNFGLVACGGKLYVIGGETNNEKILGSVERYCPFRKTWEEITPLNTPRMGLAATKYRDTIWVAGGFTASKRLAITRNVEVYDQRQNTWTFNSQLRIPRGFSSLLVMNDTLYLIGGATNNIASTVSRKAISISDVDVWDDHEEEWRIHSQLNTPRHGHSVCLLGNTVLVIGGVSTVRMCALNDVEMWSMEGGNWNSGIAELPTTVSGHGSITLPPASLL